MGFFEKPDMECVLLVMWTAVYVSYIELAYLHT